MNASTVINRPDFEVIASFIKRGESVLDLGCGDGSLLRYLQESVGVRGYGVELEPSRVLAAVANGVNVIQSDLEAGLAGFKDKTFDHVILSLTLQAMHRTEWVLSELLRVGREAIVSFPNFGYWRHRMAILNGRMPVSESLPYQWYNTPNVRFFTMSDFETLCAERGIQVVDRRALDGDTVVAEEPNFLASVAVYRLRRE